MHNPYSIKVQVIRSKGRNDRFYVVIPMPLAAAIDLNQGEDVYWKLIDRETMQLKRYNPKDKTQTLQAIKSKKKRSAS